MTSQYDAQRVGKGRGSFTAASRLTAGLCHFGRQENMDSKLHILQHSLGLDKYGDGNQYRNHFVTGPGSTDFDDAHWWQMG